MKGTAKIYGAVIASILLIGVGAALAMWYETLRINTYVHTGEVKVKWSNWSCSDIGPDPQAPGFNNTESKDVAQCIVSVEERAHDPPDPVKLNVTLVNAYPGYAVNITLVVDNIGTIPVKLLSYNFTHFEQRDVDALQVSLFIPCDTQIEPGGNSTYILEIIVLQTANESSTYSFDLELTFAQWNEVP